MINSIKLLYLSRQGRGRGAALAGLTNRYLHEMGIHDVYVDFAGIDIKGIESLKQTDPRICSVTGEILSSEHDLDMGDRKIKHLGEVLQKDYDLILTPDKHTAYHVWDHSHRLYDRTLMAGDYGGSGEEIHEPDHYYRALGESGQSDDSGCSIMVAKADAIARGVAERIARERDRLLGR